MLPTDFSEPKIIDFPSVGTPNSGFITIAEFQKTIPFEIKRVYWTYYTPHHIERGGHAHHEPYQVLVAACGIVDISCEDRAGNINNFILNSLTKD